MVECGACEHRFRVDDESLVKNRKFYPGEKRDLTLMRYGRQPHLEFAAPPQQDVVHYAEAPAVDRIEPTPFGRIMVGLVGGAIMAITLLVLMTGGGTNGFLDGVTTDRRLIVAGFVAVVGATMILYANPRSRAKALVFALLAAAALLASPFIFTEGSKELIRPPAVVTAPPKIPVILQQAAVDAEILREDVGYAPMENALMEVGQNGRVVGIWLKGMTASNSDLVLNYLLRVSAASETSHLYPRTRSNYLLVLINPQISIEELALECERLGEVDRVVPELHLIDATIHNQRFIEQPIAKLSDKSDSSFYEMNYAELQGIDIKRVNDALVRLSLAEPLQSRDDIVKRMKELIAMSDREMLTNLGKALTVWSKGDDGAPELAAKAAKTHFEKQQNLPIELVTFLTKWRQAEIYPVLEKLWLNDVTYWEETFMKSGGLAEPRVIPHLTHQENRYRMSAARILGRVGGNASLSALKEAEENTTVLELQTSYRNAMDAIRQRQPE
jgi:hypothetical protein